jgi:hypothetical protein
MNIIIKETGETKELLYGADYNQGDAASDIIGNSGVTEAWEYDDKRDMFVVPQKDADFWEKYLRETGEAADDITAAKKEYRKAAGKNHPESEKPDIENDYTEHAALMRQTAEKIRAEAKEIKSRNHKNRDDAR